MPDAAVLATILLVVGLFLVAVEMMIPSFGLIGASAGVCLVISAWSAWQAWWGTSPVFFWTYVGFFAVGIPTVFFGTIYLIQHTVFGTFVILRAQEQSEDGPHPAMQSHLHNLIGQLGKTVSTLTPGGMVEVAGERHHAESVGPIIDSRQTITVVKIRGTRLVVRKCDEQQIDETAPEPIPPQTRIKQKKPGQLDFDIPENYTDK
jgi:membrane-bound serine protease (ClpP class)